MEARDVAYGDQRSFTRLKTYLTWFRSSENRDVVFLCVRRAEWLARLFIAKK
jgi:hypothetical protein